MSENPATGFLNLPPNILRGCMKQASCCGANGFWICGTEARACNDGAQSSLVNAFTLNLCDPYWFPVCHLERATQWMANQKLLIPLQSLDLKNMCPQCVIPFLDSYHDSKRIKVLKRIWCYTEIYCNPKGSETSQDGTLQTWVVPPSVWLASPRQLEQQHAAPMSTHRFSTKTLVISRPKRQFRPKILSNWVGTGKQTGKTLGLWVLRKWEGKWNIFDPSTWQQFIYVPKRALRSGGSSFNRATARRHTCRYLGPSAASPLSISFDVTSPGLQLIRLGTAIASEGLGLGSSRFYSPLRPLSSPSFQLPCAALAHRFRRLKQPP